MDIKQRSLNGYTSTPSKRNFPIAWGQFWEVPCDQASQISVKFPVQVDWSLISWLFFEFFWNSLEIFKFENRPLPVGAKTQIYFHVSHGFHDIEISTVNCQTNTSLCRSVNWSGAAVDQFMVLPSAISPYFLLTPYFVCLRAELFMQKWLLLLPYNVKIQFSGKWFLPFFMMNYYNGVKTPILFCIHRTLYATVYLKNGECSLMGDLG